MAGRPVHVIATTDEGTERALATAARRAIVCGKRVVLIVPHVVALSGSQAGPLADPGVIAEPYRALASATGVDATVRVCFCRDPSQVYARLFLEESDVVVGGRRRWWWPSREQRLARSLANCGHRVTFADARVAER